MLAAKTECLEVCFFITQSTSVELNTVSDTPPGPSTIMKLHTRTWAFPLWFLASRVVLEVKNLLANAGDAKDAVLIPGSGRSPGVGQGNALQYSFLGNSMDREAWRNTVQGVAKSTDRTEHAWGAGGGGG